MHIIIAYLLQGKEEKLQFNKSTINTPCFFLYVSVCRPPPVPSSDWRAVVQWCALSEIPEPFSVPDAGHTCGACRLPHAVYDVPHCALEQGKCVIVYCPSNSSVSRFDTAPSICLSACLSSLCLSISLSFSVSLSLSAFLCLSVSVSVCLSVSVPVSVSVSVCIYIYI